MTQLSQKPHDRTHPPSTLPPHRAVVPRGSVGCAQGSFSGVYNGPERSWWHLLITTSASSLSFHWSVQYLIWGKFYGLEDRHTLRASQPRADCCFLGYLHLFSVIFRFLPNSFCSVFLSEESQTTRQDFKRNPQFVENNIFQGKGLVSTLFPPVTNNFWKEKCWSYFITFQKHNLVFKGFSFLDVR